MDRLKDLDMSIKKLLRDAMIAKSVVIGTHINTDGDAHASMLGMAHMVRSVNPGAEINLFAEHPEGDGIGRYRHMYEGSPFKLNDNKKLEFRHDLGIVTDCATAPRLGKFRNPVLASKKTYNFDHHEGNTMFADENIVDTGASSASQMEAEFLLANNADIPVGLANILFAGMYTDNEFGWGMSPRALRTAAALSPLAETERVIDIFNSSTIEGEALLRLADRIYAHDNRFLAASMDKNVIKNAGATLRDTFGISTALINKRGVDVAATFAQQPDGVWCCSFRGKNGYSVIPIAEAFGGGGRREKNFSIAACMTEKDPSELLAFIMPYVEHMFQNSKKNSVNPFMNQSGLLIPKMTLTDARIKGGIILPSTQIVSPPETYTIH